MSESKHSWAAATEVRGIRYKPLINQTPETPPHTLLITSFAKEIPRFIPEPDANTDSSCHLCIASFD